MDACNLGNMTIKQLQNQYSISDGNPVRQHVIRQFMKRKLNELKVKQDMIKQKQNIKKIQELKTKDDNNDDVSYDSISESDVSGDDSYDLWDGDENTDSSNDEPEDKLGVEDMSDLMREEEKILLTKDKINTQLSSRLGSDIFIKDNQKQMAFSGRPIARIFDDSF